jgi:hypothetical protein
MIQNVFPFWEKSYNNGHFSVIETKYQKCPKTTITLTKNLRIGPIKMYKPFSQLWLIVCVIVQKPCRIRCFSQPKYRPKMPKDHYKIDHKPKKLDHQYKLKTLRAFVKFTIEIANTSTYWKFQV